MQLRFMPRFITVVGRAGLATIFNIATIYKATTRQYIKSSVTCLNTKNLLPSECLFCGNALKHKRYFLMIRDFAKCYCFRKKYFGEF